MYALIEQHFNNYYQTFIKRINHRVKNVYDAEDIVMEAYARALQYHNAYDGSKPFDHWFSRILTNSVKDWKREQHNQHSYAEEFNENEMKTVSDPSIKKDLLSTLSAEIALLKNEEHAAVLVLYYLLGYKPREIVQITDVKIKMVNYITQRFKYRLKEQYME